MLFYVVKCFPVYLEHLVASSVGKAQVAVFDKEIDGQAGFIAIAFRKTEHQLPHIRAFHTYWPQVGHHSAELFALLLNGGLQHLELLARLFGGPRKFAAEDVELDIQAQQGLEYSIVQVARNSAAF